jgi:hypothetical protein
MDRPFRRNGNLSASNGVETVRASQNYSTGAQAEAAEEPAVVRVRSGGLPGVLTGSIHFDFSAPAFAACFW